jgi:hypothetical protein
VPAGGQSVVIPDIFGKPLSDAMRQLIVFPAKRPANQKLLLNVTVKGHLVSGGEVSTEPFAFPITMRFDDPFSRSVGNATQTVAILVDGGHADEVILSDGTPVLGDAFVQADGTVGVTDGGTSYSDGAVSALKASLGTDGGTSISGVNPCE